MYNKCMKWIRQPVPALAYATARPEQLTSYAGRYVAHLWGDDMPHIRERRITIYCVLLAGLLIFWDGVCSDIWRSDNG